MGALKPKALLVFFVVQSLFLTGLVLLHVNFTLPMATLEGVDVLALPEQDVQLSCMVKVDRPEGGEAATAGFSVLFHRGSTLVGTATTGETGLASVPFKTSDRLRESFEIDLGLSPAEEFSCHLPRPTLYLKSLGKGSTLFICDVECTLTSSWSALDTRHPNDWEQEEGAAQKLKELVGQGRHIVYVAPGAVLLTTEVRHYLRSELFPEGPIFFPEAPPRARPLPEFLSGLKKNWSFIRFVLTRRKALIEAAAAADLSVVVVNAPPGQTAGGAEVLLAPNWTGFNYER
jgi:hypothetical protein